MPFRDGKLRQDSAIIFRMQEENTSFLDLDWMSRVVEKAVTASEGVSIISFDLETLEELGSEFHQQDKERAGEGNQTTAGWEPNMESFTTFLAHFFTTPSKTKAGRKARQRNQHVLSTVLDAVNVKEKVRCPKMEERDGPNAVLIHIMDCSLVNRSLGSGTKRGVLAHFAQMVRARRRQGETVAILLSTKSHRYPLIEEEFKDIRATRGSTVTASRDNIPNWDQRNEVRTGIINTQRLRRFMRHHLPSDLICSELLTFNSDWASADRAQTYKSFGKRLWSLGDVEKTITLLVGQGWRDSKARPQISFTDMCDVLERLALFRQVGPDSKSQETEETGEKGEAGEFHISAS